VGRAVASAALWPDAPDDVARANLRRALWHLPPGWVESIGEELSLEADCDLAELREIAGGAVAGAPLTLNQIALLSQDILPGWHEEWLSGPQEAFRMLRVQALECACRTMAASGEFALATQAGVAAVTAEPLSESAAEALIVAHLAQHNRHAAAQCYAALVRRLRQELGVGPDPTLASRLNVAGIAAQSIA
jgi:DNA-binding SARP family transcriptional activator